MPLRIGRSTEPFARNDCLEESDLSQDDKRRWGNVADCCRCAALTATEAPIRIIEVAALRIFRRHFETFAGALALPRAGLLLPASRVPDPRFPATSATPR